MSGYHKRRNDNGEGGSHGSRFHRRGQKHPSNLKGRDIGMFYAQRSKAREQKIEEQNARPIGVVLLSEKTKNNIEKLLCNNLSGAFAIGDGSYDHIQDSKFKREFMKVLQGNSEDKSINIIAREQNINLDNELYEEFELRKSTNVQYNQMLQVRKRLPSFEMRHELLRLINEHQVVVISGETGCGKTTQVAQFILDDFIEKKKGSLCHIICTQPRRISAISVAERVAQERGETVGCGSIGYTIRLESQVGRSKGSILFCTTGVILRQMEQDPYLRNVSHLILDEIHERDVVSDFLISLVKQIINKRKDIKIILMSATLNSEQFSRYYDNCPHINIPGFTYPVEEFYLEDVLQRTNFCFDDSKVFHDLPKHLRYRGKRGRVNAYSEFIEPHIRQLEAERKYSWNVCAQLRNPICEKLDVDLILALLINICENDKENGAILVFLSGFAEISKLNQLIENSGRFPPSRHYIIPLHSQMPTIDQKSIFNRCPQGIRKIVLSTNIAETSITIDDIIYVVDCGKIKIKNYDVEKNTQTLQPEWVSLANANQRRGRAGRVQSGVCFHLFSQARNMLLEKYPKPEILRTRLENTILTVKILNLGKIDVFLSSLLDPPDPKVVEASVNLLKRLNALDEDENLTPLGYHLAKLPISPQIGKMILLGAIFGCLNPVLCVAATLDFKDAFQIPLSKEKIADAKKQELSPDRISDHLVYYEALNRFENLDSSSARQFCWEYFLSYQTLSLLVNLKTKFMEYLHDLNFVPSKDPHCAECNANSDNMSLVKAIICAGLYPNVGVARTMKNGRSRNYTVENERVYFHPKSILNKLDYFQPPLFVYHLKLKTTADFIHDATLVQSLPLIFFGDNFKVHRNDNANSISICNSLRFKCTVSTAATITALRNRLNLFLEYKVSHPGVIDWTTDNEEIRVLASIVELITCEDMGEYDLEAYDDYD